MTTSELEVRYTPSEWSSRYKSVELLAHFMAYCEKVTKKVRSTTKCHLDVSYGTTDRTKYDVYGTDLPEDAPIFVFIHGGYWQEFSKDLAGFSVPTFVENGIKVITIGYDLCPNVRLGDIVSQIKSATEQILQTASKSKSRCVWIAGHSAGAHLAASLLHDEEWAVRMAQKGYLQLLKGVVLIAGVYNLKPLVGLSFNDALKLNDDEIASFSLSTTAATHGKINKELKVIVVVGECDSPVFVEESREYAQRLTTFVDNVEYVLLHNKIDHFDIVENLVNPTFVLTKMLLRHIAPQ